MSPMLYTTIRNTSGAKLHCSFIGVSGQNLAANAEVTLFGSLVDILREGAFGFGQHIAPRRKQLEDYIEDGKLTVIATPAVVVKDAGSGKSYLIKSTSDAAALEVVYAPATTAAATTTAA